MREIKFRGKTKEGKWVYGSYHNNCEKFGEDEGTHWIGSYVEVSSNFSEKTWLQYEDFEVIPETIGQYTGLKDKNGVEIYEGDVLKGISANEFSKGEIRNYEVMWGVDSWHIKGTGFSIQELINYTHEDIEVIGNIHDKN